MNPPQDLRLADSLSRGTTAEEVAAVLREMIMNGRLAPDTPMREASLSAQFEVSRRTVREALGILELEGVVRHHRHKGSRVTQFDAKDIHDLYRVRRTMELAAAQASETASQAARDALTVALEHLSDASKAGVAQDIVRRDLEFHQAVVGLLDSPRLDRFFAVTAVEMRYALSLLEASYQESRRRPRAAFGEHRAIYEALIQNDHVAAAALISEHTATNEERLVRAVVDSLETPPGTK